MCFAPPFVFLSIYGYQARSFNAKDVQSGILVACAVVEFAAILFSAKLALELQPHFKKFVLLIARAAFGPETPEPNKQVDLRRLAYHEAGHAVFRWFNPELATVNHVTILPSNDDLGHVQPEPHESKLPTPEWYRAEIASSLSGRVAEEVAGLGISSAASHDIKNATAWARLMITELGMSERIGLVHVDVDTCSNQMMIVIESEISVITNEARNTSKSSLEKHREALDGVAAALLNRQTLDTKALEELLGPR
ncbi:MAG TPA: hypothetical protein VNO24_20225, partial [Blastocatellia bacterium]|nr:hypothetical protein [Blastocatellia bacterium]